MQTPPFLLTYWNPFNMHAPGLGQSFLNYVKDVSLATYTGEITGSYIQQASRQQNLVLKESFSALENASSEQVSVLREGFSFLNQGLSMIRQEQINTNILLENIGELLKLPDSEKQRQRHIELGLKFSIQSLKNEDLATDAKTEFDKALSIMQQDWFVLQQLGMLLLYHEKILDLEKAKEYFLKDSAN